MSGLRQTNQPARPVGILDLPLEIINKVIEYNKPCFETELDKQIDECVNTNELIIEIHKKFVRKLKKGQKCFVAVQGDCHYEDTAYNFCAKFVDYNDKDCFLPKFIIEDGHGLFVFLEVHVYDLINIRLADDDDELYLPANFDTEFENQELDDIIDLDDEFRMYIFWINWAILHIFVSPDNNSMIEDFEPNKYSLSH